MSDNQITPTPQSRLDWIEPAKGLAIIMVLLYHSDGYLGLGNPFHGDMGVDAFLLLSGFGLAYSRRIESARSFLYRRWLKLFPAYWLVLSLFLISDTFIFGLPFSLKDAVLHFTALHLIAGDPYSFSINMSFWYIGLIVPLYACFALLRSWMRGASAYSALGISLIITSVLGALILLFGQSWGGGAQAHTNHRLSQFFIGAILGLVFQRQERLADLVNKPFLLAGFVVMIAIPLWFGWGQYAEYLVGGLAIIAVGMLVTALCQRWPIIRPFMIALTVVGGLSYEMYLVHQYLLVQVNDRFLVPWLAIHVPHLFPFGRKLLAVCLALSVAWWVAWAVRWVFARANNAKTWRVTLRVVGATTILTLAAGLVYVWQISAIKPRVFQLNVQMSATAPVGAEPIIYLGSAGAGDLVFLEHDGQGRVRVGVDHWGIPALHTDWTSVGALDQGTWKVQFEPTQLIVQAGTVTLTSPSAPYDPNAPPVIARNDIGFSTAAPQAISHVTLVGN